MSPKRRRILFLLVLVVLMIALPAWEIHHEMRRERLNQLLIAAIRTENTTEALALLRQGADGTARVKGQENLTFRQALQHLFDHLFHRGTGEEHYGALLLLYQLAEKRNTTGKEPLTNAALVHALLERGAYVQDGETGGNSVLWYSVKFHQPDVVKIVLERGANVNTVDAAGNTPLMGADIEEARILLEHGAKLEAKDLDGKTPLFYAEEDVVDLLLQHGANQEATDVAGNTPLLYACMVGDDSSVQRLLRHGANVNAKNAQKETPLYYAERNCLATTIQALAQKGAILAPTK